MRSLSKVRHGCKFTTSWNRCASGSISLRPWPVQTEQVSVMLLQLGLMFEDGLLQWVAKRRSAGRMQLATTALCTKHLNGIVRKTSKKCHDKYRDHHLSHCLNS